MNKTPPGPQRLKIYFTERFPILIYLPFVVILYFALYALSQFVLGTEIKVDSHFSAGVISAFFLMLLVRTFDDLKDAEFDKDVFPDRPVSRGDVLVSDVEKLALGSLIILVLVNVLWLPKALPVFFTVLIYLLLTFKWFFAKELHLKKPVVAMITHQPIPLSIIFFLIYTTLPSDNSQSFFSVFHFAILLIFAFPITAWEVSRKTKAKVNENKYETFTKILGTTIAPIIPLVFYAIAISSSFFLAFKLHFHPSFYVIIAFQYIVMAYFYIRFILHPTPKNNVLKNVSMAFTSSFFITLLSYSIYFYFAIR